MALHWSVADVADHDNVCFYIAEAEDAGRGIDVGDKLLNGITKSLIFATIPVGFGTITEANAKEFYTRLSAWERLYGATCYNGDGSDRFITREDVTKHVGLSTNASDKTTRQFWVDLGGTWNRSLNRG